MYSNECTQSSALATSVSPKILAVSNIRAPRRIIECLAKNEKAAMLDFYGNFNTGRGLYVAHYVFVDNHLFVSTPRYLNSFN